MSTVGDRETSTQARVLAFLQKVLGYTYFGHWQTRQGNSNIKKELLTDWLRSRGHDDAIITKVLFELEKAAALGGSRKLYEANREVHGLLRYGVNVQSGDYVDLKAYEPDMRHLIDTYIRAEESETLSTLGDIPLVELRYRQHLKSQLPSLLEKWEAKLSVSVNEVRIKKMKTRWGSCNIEAKRIWLNLELAKKPESCLMYILVHEMVHLLERAHNDRFRELMDNFLPQWRAYRNELNRAPLAHEDWRY